MNVTRPNEISILVVDDQPDNILLVRHILETEGYKIDYAENGPQALEMVTDKDYGLILLDIVMPGMDGYSVCKELKKKPKIKEIPVIFLTGQSGVDGIVKGFKVGAVDYIKKPFKTKEIRVRVKTHVQLKQAKDALNEKYEKEKKLTEELKKAISKIKTLTGLLPICSYCHKIKDDDGYWQRVDNYLRNHSEVDFTHGICDECSEKLKNELDI